MMNVIMTLNKREEKKNRGKKKAVITVIRRIKKRQNIMTGASRTNQGVI